MTKSARYFVIFGAMRTGSNLVEKSLGELPDITIHGELFNPSFVGKPRRDNHTGWSIKDRDSDPVGFLKAVLAAHPDKISGMRIFNGHDRKAMAHALTDPACRRIILTRDPVESWVSLAIARETDQWILRNPERRISTRVTFVPEAYEAYREELERHYAWLEFQMAEAGTSALHVDYSQLTQPGVLGEIATYVGSDHHLPALPPIHRQNPEPMAAKVVNYPEMVDHLGGAEANWTAPPPPPVSLADLRFGNHAPFALAPIKGAGHEAALGLMQRIERLRFGGPSEPAAGLVERVAKGEVFRSGLSDTAAAAELTGRLAFTVVRHPVARAHAAFVRDLFGPGWQQNPLRRAVQENIGPLPSLFMIERSKGRDPTTVGFGPGLHARAFRFYLDLVEGALSGDGHFALRMDWRPQAELLDYWWQLVPSLEIARYEDFAQFADSMTQRLGVAPLPPGQVYSLQMLGQYPPLPCIRALSGDTVEMVRALYLDDFEELGYGDLTAQMEDPRAAA